MLENVQNCDNYVENPMFNCSPKHGPPSVHKIFSVLSNMDINYDGVDSAVSR
jgi:hypothetical protein